MWPTVRGCVTTCISREEVEDAAPGKDEVTMNMVLAEVLFDVWVTLFEVYWEDSIVPLYVGRV